MPFLSTVKSSYGFGRGVEAIKGVVTTLAGSGSGAFANGTGTGASFWFPYGVAVIPSTEVIIVGDYRNHCIRLVTLGGVVTTLAGSGNAGFADGTGAAASFNFPTGVAYNPITSNIAVADSVNQRIRLVTLDGVVTTLAGSGFTDQDGYGAFADGTGTEASFASPQGVAVIPSTGVVVVADTQNHRIRLITPAGVVTTLAGSSFNAFADGVGEAANFSYPVGVAVIPSSEVIVVGDSGNGRIRLVTPEGVTTSLAGYYGGGFADGTGEAARFTSPRGVAYDPITGNIVVAASDNNRIRIVTLSGVVTTLAGNSPAAFSNGTGAAARFSGPQGVAVIPSTGVIIVADTTNNRIRLIR